MVALGITNSFLRPFHRKEIMTNTANLVKFMSNTANLVGKVMGTRWEPTATILLNGHADKLPSAYFFLYHPLMLLSTFAAEAAFCCGQQLM